MKKISNSFLSILFGIILIIAGIILIFWNEQNNVKNIATVDELRKVVVEVNNTSIDVSNDNQLVNVSGKLQNLDYLTDSQFGVNILSAKLKRSVEMYQWVESCTTDSKDQKTCSYSKEWKSSIMDSEHYPSDYKNPKDMPYQSYTSVSKNAKLGDFNISSEQLAYLYADTKYNDFSYLPSGYTQFGNYVTNSSDINNPKIGDIRIEFTYVADENVTVLAKQKGNEFVDYITKKGKNIFSISSGTKSSQEIIQKIENSNNTLKWILRVLSMILELFGFILLFSLITTISSYVPVLGSLVGGVTFVIAFLLSTIVTLVCTAIAWFVSRPMLSIILLLISGLLFYLLMKRKNKKMEEVK